MSDRAGNILAFLAVVIVFTSVLGVTGYALHTFKEHKYHKQFAVP